MEPKFGGSVSGTEYIDHCGIYIDMSLLECQLYKTIDVNFISQLKKWCLISSGVYIYIYIYTEVILWLSGFVDSSFDLLCSFKVSLQNILPVKGVEIYINHQNFSLTSIIGLLP